MADESNIRKLIVTEQKALATLNNGSVLYETFVTDEQGEKVDLPFRAFVELEVGVVTAFEVRPHDTEKFGRTFTLLPQERESRTKQLARKVEELSHRVTEMENTMEERVKELVAAEYQRLRDAEDVPF